MQAAFSYIFIFFWALLASQMSQALVVLQYHHVSDDTPAITSIRPKQFAQHMQYLADNNFTVLDIKQLPNILETQKLPDKTVIITFDDGYSSIYDNALPILKKHGFAFTVFISSEPHDQQLDGYLTWQQLKALQQHSGTLANHSYGHEHLIRANPNATPAFRKRIWRDNIEKNQQRIKQQTGSNLKLFAYPYGEYTPELQSLLEQMGYLAFAQLSGPISTDSSHTALPRFPFGGSYTDMDDFILKVNTKPFSHMLSSTYDENGQALSSPLLPQGVAQPRLVLRFSQNPPKQMQCFASLQGKTHLSQQQNSWVAQAKKPLQAGRRRYNCTASAGDGRFYWHSEFFMKKHEDGSWYSEY